MPCLNMRNFFKTLPILAALTLLPGVSCGPGAGTAPGGIHFSQDKGATWSPRNVLITAEGQGSLARQSILDLEIDNQGIVYAATGRAGLYKSDNKGESWLPLTTQGQIQAMDVHDNDNNKLAAARNNQIFVSTDGGEIWQLVYTDPANQIITDILFDPLVNNRIYATLAGGQLLRSFDNGKTWTLVHEFNHTVRAVRLSPGDVNRIYIVSLKNGIFRSDDEGKTFNSISESIGGLLGIIQFTDLQIHPSNANRLLLSTNKGLYASSNGGESWTQLSLLSDPETQNILAIALDPNNHNRIYYSTPTVLHRSDDAGSSWSTNPFFSAFLPTELVVDSENSNNVFIGTSEP